ncbi:MAG: nucleoside monophosphate kinase [bacterium]|nr:nucleoside monophosphate kinase [bacterium]
MIIVFLGPPGSGKGTQAEQLREKYGFEHFDTGSQLRKEADSGSDLGARIGGFINDGNFVTIEIIQELVLKFLRETSSERIMFDGFPRDLDQARVLDEGLAEIGRPLYCALYLEIAPDTLLERIMHRRMCPKCGTIYNLKTHAPRLDEVCDRDGEKLTQRADDTPETFKTRLSNYMSKTVPVLEFYRGRESLCVIDADRSIEDVAASIVDELGLDKHGEA